MKKKAKNEKKQKGRKLLFCEVLINSMFDKKVTEKEEENF